MPHLVGCCTSSAGAALASAPALGRDHRMVWLLLTGASPGTGAASRQSAEAVCPTEAFPKDLLCSRAAASSASSRLCSSARSYLLQRKIISGSALYLNLLQKGSRSLPSSPHLGEMPLQTCCVESIMIFLHALVLICRPMHAATGRAQQLSTHE